MRLYVVCFAAGVWWLQVQSQLPAPRWYWLAAPLGLVALLAAQPSLRPLRATQLVLAAGCCVACGILWAAWLAGQRLDDALPLPWEGADIQLVGVVAEGSYDIGVERRSGLLAQQPLDVGDIDLVAQEVDEPGHLLDACGGGQRGARHGTGMPLAVPPFEDLRQRLAYPRWQGEPIGDELGDLAAGHLVVTDDARRTKQKQGEPVVPSG